MAQGMSIALRVRATGRRLRRQHVMTHVLLLLVGLAVMLPFLWMVTTSLKFEGDARLYPPTLFPERIKWDNYTEVFTRFPFLRALWNSTYIAALTIAGQLVSCALAAYAFAQMEFPAKRPLFGAILATMMVPPSVTLIPTFILMGKLGWVNTHLPLTVPAFFGGAFGIFLLRQHFMTIPREYYDAAMIDGASQIRVLVDVYVPMAKPVLATLTIFTFMHSWNAFLAPLIYISDIEKMTMTLAIAAFTMRQYYTPYTLLMAGAVINVLPTLTLYMLTQKYFVRGLVLSGLKG